MRFLLSPLTLGGACIAMATGFVAGRDAPTLSPINEFCPVMTEEKVDARYQIEFEGRTIGFCCEKCVAKFQANPDRYRALLPQLAALDGATSQPGMLGNSPVAAARLTSAQGWVQLLGRYHPVFVHFPVAGFPLALLGLGLWLLTGSARLSAADVPPLVAGAAASILAVVTGNIAEAATSFSAALQPYLRWHEYAGTTLMVMGIALAALRLWRWRGLAGVWLFLYAGGLVSASLIAAASGFLGGTLVFGVGHLSP